MENTKTKLERYRERYEKNLARDEELRKKIKQEEIKRRNHLLIQLGVVVESLVGRELEDEDVDRLRSFLQKQENNGKYFTKAMNPKSTDPIFPAS